MEERKCIYCGKGTSDNVIINESDIIPDSLTNAKIRLKNVCSIEHNSNFSDKFECKVIEELAFLRNHLNIIGKNKGNKFPQYQATLKIDGKTYKTKGRNKAELIGNKKIRSQDGSHLLGPLNELIKMKNSKERIRKTIDLNNEEIEVNVSLNTPIFISEEIYRLVSKIAYEWFCKVNDINGKNIDFDNIINYIVSGTIPIEHNIVSPISDEQVYKAIQETKNIGSHYLYSYISEAEEINVVVSFFGIAIYNVILCKNTNFPKITFAEEFILTGDKKFISNSDIANLVSDLINIPSFNVENGLAVSIPLLTQDKISITDKLDFLNFKLVINNFNSNFILDDFTKLVINNYKNLVSSSILDIKILKRFVKDYNLIENIKLNINGSDSNFWFLLYIIFYIGKNNCETLTLNAFNSIIEKIFLSEFDFSQTLTSNIALNLKSKILKDSNYSQFIINGANIIVKL